MSAYKLNEVDLSVYGIIAGHSQGSNIAVAGCFDLPARTGKCFHAWEETDAVEPYVDSDELFFAGRDLIFEGMILGTIQQASTLLSSLYTAIALFDDYVPFETPYGNWNVTVTSITPEYHNGVTSVTIKFREPWVYLAFINGVDFNLPSQGSSPYLIDSIPMSSLGLYVTRPIGHMDLPDMKECDLTMYGKEAFKLTTRTSKTLTIDGFVVGSSLDEFMTRIKYLLYLFSKSGTRTIKLNDQFSVVCFATKGFRVGEVQVFGTGVIANFRIELMVTSVTIL